MLALQGLDKRFGATHAVRSVSLAIPAGTFVGVIGRSGAGKSTLLRMINRLCEPSAGRILWRGQDVTALRGADLRDWRRRCAMIFQQFNLVGQLDVLTNVLTGRLGHRPSWRALLGRWSNDDRAMAFAALETFDMGAFAARRAGQLSGGQQQRVAICRALLQEPDLILADEPIASLDPRNARVVMDSLARVNREFGLTVIVNIHALDLARAYCGRLIGMADGAVVFDGPPAALDARSARALYGPREHGPAEDTMPAPSPVASTHADVPAAAGAA